MLFVVSYEGIVLSKPADVSIRYRNRNDPPDVGGWSGGWLAGCQALVASVSCSSLASAGASSSATASGASSASASGASSGSVEASGSGSATASGAGATS